MTSSIRAVFFDVGGTLGSVDAALHFAPFADSAACLAVLRKTLGLRLGIISNVPNSMSTDELWTLLATANLTSLLERELVVTSRDVGAAKPAAAIYRAAAKLAALPIADCLYVGENATEVDGAIAAGMTALLKPART